MQKTDFKTMLYGSQFPFIFGDVSYTICDVTTYRSELKVARDSKLIRYDIFMLF